MLLDAVKQIVKENDKKVLLNIPRVKELLSDLAKGDYKHHTMAFIECLEHGILQSSLVCTTNTEMRKNYKEQFARTLRVRDGLDIELFRVAIDIICEVFWDEEPQDKTYDDEPRFSYFSDPRDGKVYKTVKIGRQVWMAENLNYDVDGSCCYDNDPVKAEKYGRLYQWETAMKVCPKGWQLPSKEDWQTLVDFVGERNMAVGKCLRARFGWNMEFGQPISDLDIYGFSALPGGFRHPIDQFGYVGASGVWWTASSCLYDTNKAYCRYMSYGDIPVEKGALLKNSACSVRCICR